MEPRNPAAEREPGLASEALRALADLARGEEPPPPEAVSRIATSPAPAPRDAEPPTERDPEEPPLPPIPRSSRLPDGVLLAVTAVPVLVCSWLFVVLILSWL